MIKSHSTLQQNEFLSKAIIGNNESIVSNLINKLKNSDWVKQGLNYLDENSDNIEKCPFCQEKTITKEIISKIKDYFDEEYENNLEEINKIKIQYSNLFQNIPTIDSYELNPKFNNFKKDFVINYNNLLEILKNNDKKISDKLQNPSSSIKLEDYSILLQKLNDTIIAINKEIALHNKKIDEIDETYKLIKQTFWEILRWEYDAVINVFKVAKEKSKKTKEILENDLIKINSDIRIQEEILVSEQKKTINIQDAITNINNSLLDLGIDSFKIKHFKENLYKIVRENNDNKIFRSLSEGEKMIISFLYFIELCKGKKNSLEVNKKKLIVIDDPISSLSHIHVLNIGRLIKNNLFGKKINKNGQIEWQFNFEQVIILTHSLYFFYELTETNHELRPLYQSLHRISKNAAGSQFTPMKYEEIQNDYQAYWYIIKDEDQPPALIANCMRNIIEYFFNFVERKDLNNFFQQPKLNNLRFQAFYRYINRESHSLGQNIFDFKEFNYVDFKDAFITLFEVAGYPEHCKKMMK